MFISRLAKKNINGIDLKGIIYASPFIPKNNDMCQSK